MVNPHIYGADVSLGSYNPRDEGYRVSQAMLALAYEQRTANLIAWRNGGKIAMIDVPDVEKQIRDRLELDTGSW